MTPHLPPFSPSRDDGAHLGSWRSPEDAYGNYRQVDVFRSPPDARFGLEDRVVIATWRISAGSGRMHGHANGETLSLPVDAVATLIAALQPLTP